MALCACGCGQEVSPGKRYVQGHYAKHAAKIAKGEMARQELADGELTGEEIIKDDQPKVSRQDYFTEFGAHGTPILAGISRADYLAKFQTLSTALAVYEQMRRSDATCQACLLVMELPICSTKFFVRPASSSLQDKEIAAFVEWNLFRGMTHTFSSFLREALGKFWAGFSWFEKVFEPYGSKVKLRKLASRAQATLDHWELDDTGGPFRAWQSAWRPDEKSYQPVPIPIQKLVVFIHRREAGDLQGTSVFRPAYKHWLVKDKLYRLEAIALERSAVGIPVITLPRNASADDKARAKEIVTSLRGDDKAGVTIPETWGLYLLGGSAPPTRSGASRGASSGGAMTSYQSTIQHHDLMIAKSVLAQFINLPGAAYGSYALSADQSNLLIQMLDFEASYFCDTVSDYVIKQLCSFNWPRLANFPRLDHSPISSRNIKILSDAWSNLASKGLLTLSPRTEEHIRGVIGFPELESAPSGSSDESEDEESLNPGDTEDDFEDTNSEDTNSKYTNSEDTNSESADSEREGT